MNIQTFTVKLHDIKVCNRIRIKTAYLRYDDYVIGRRMDGYTDISTSNSRVYETIINIFQGEILQ